MKNNTNEKSKNYLNKFLHFYNYIFNKKKLKESENSLRHTIEELIEEDNDGEQSIESDERELIVNVLNLRDLTASDVMVPHCDIIAASINSNSEEIISFLIKHNISVLPIYIETIDNIIGVLSMRDALVFANQKEENKNLKDLIEDVCYIAPSMRILDLLFQMRETGMKLAVVVDEYGGVYGIVTFSNLVEEIIGDIQYPENINNENKLKIQSNGTIVVDARTTIDELQIFLEENSINNIDFFEGTQDEDIDTVGGLIMFMTGRVPTRGELIKHKAGYEFEILDADLRKINKVAIHKIKSKVINKELPLKNEKNQKKIEMH